MGLRDRVPALVGSNPPLADRRTPRPSPGAEALVEEAMRTDTDLPLYAVFGASLTQLASAYLLEPRIQDRLTAVWIGGRSTRVSPRRRGPTSSSTTCGST
jgi:purine nucleosidase